MLDAHSRSILAPRQGDDPSMAEGDAAAPRMGAEAACGRTVVPTPTDAYGEETVATFGTLSVTVTGGPDAPASSGGAVASQADDAAMAADTGDVLTYSLTEDAAGLFAIDAKTGVILVREARRLGRDEPDAHMIVVRASDGRGAVFERRILVPVIDIIGQTPPRSVATDAAQEKKTPVDRSIYRRVEQGGFTSGRRRIRRP